VAAIAVGGAPTDILKEVAVRPEMESVFEARIPNYAVDREAALKSRSVMYWAEKLPKSTPILILHGQSDANVTVNSALDLAAELQVLEIPYRLVIYENGTHALFEYKQQVITELLNWFEDKLD
jgi:dipeptidyl aminopeptidase/acylaminoacyl peptidase